MSNSKLLQLKNILTIGLLTILAGLVAFSVSIWTTPKYKSTFKLLAVSSQNNIDTYTASKTANYITGILGEVIYSDSLIDSVYSANTNLEDLGYGSERRLRQWKKMVKTKVLENKGLMIIDVYGNDKVKTNALANTLALTIINNHGNYDGASDRITIKMIDQPSVYDSWSMTKIMENTGLGILVGLLLGFTFVVIFPNHRLFKVTKKEKYFYPPTPVAPATEVKQQPAVTAQSDYQPAIRLNSQPQPIQEVPANQQPVVDTTPYTASNNEWLKDYYNNNQS